MRAAELDDRAVHQHHRDPEQVVGGHPVLQAMGAAGVHRDVAGDGAGELAGRVGRVEEVVRLHRPGHAQVGAPGLHADEAVVEVDLQHLRQPGHPEHHAVRGRQRAAGEAGAGAARHHRHPLGGADAHDRRHLLGRGRQHDRERRAAVGRQGVALVGADLGRVVDHRVRRQHLLQPPHDLGLAREDRRIRLGHLHRSPPRRNRRRAGGRFQAARVRARLRRRGRGRHGRRAIPARAGHRHPGEPHQLSAGHRNDRRASGAAKEKKHFPTQGLRRRNSSGFTSPSPDG